MDSSNTGWIVVVVAVALIVLGVLLWAGRRQRDIRRTAKAEEMREQLRREDVAVRHRESIAAETEARARAAQAEAEAKSAEAARLQHAAEGHRAEVSSSRDDLEKRWAQADSLDPRGAGMSPDHSDRLPESERQVRPSA